MLNTTSRNQHLSYESIREINKWNKLFFNKKEREVVEKTIVSVVITVEEEWNKQIKVKKKDQLPD